MKATEAHDAATRGVVSSKPTILIVEDEVGPREAFKVILRPFFNLYWAEDAVKAMEVLRWQKIDLVTLDLKLPGQPGMELLQEIRRQQIDVEVIIVTGYGSLKSGMDGLRYGAAAYLLKPFNVTELIEVVNQVLEKKRRLDGLRDTLHETLRTCSDLWGTELDPKAACKNLASLVKAKSPELARHSSRVSFYAALLAERVNLAAADREALQIGAWLHDIGKLGLDVQPLTRPTTLTPEEDALLKRHPEIGARLVHALPLPPVVGQIVRYHHEHYDGSGYPGGLQGEEIPYLARIVGLANAYDHLLTRRPDCETISVEQAGEYVRNHAGSLFDPELAELFPQVVK